MSADTPAAGSDELPVLSFPDGIPGFPDARRFVLTDLTDDGTFQLLEALDTELSMVVSVPWLFFPDYEPELGPEDQTELGIAEPQDALVFCSVTADDDSDDVLYVNLLGPFVVNATTRVGRQVVLVDQDLPVRAPIHATNG
jgi:flagellar assembly factor FliW